jgi:hypothetical protein
MEYNDVNRLHGVHKGEEWWAFVNTEINLQCSIKGRRFGAELCHYWL